MLGAYLASAAELGDIEALRIEAGGASGGAALRQAMLAVASGAYDVVAVLGVEKPTDLLDGAVEAALALELDGDWEAAVGLTLSAGWALLMRRYMHEYGYEAADFVPFPVNAHRNAGANPQAQYRSAIKPEQVLRSPQVAAPIAMLDSSTPADGAAAVIVAAEQVARELEGPRVRIGGSAVAGGPHALHARPDLLWLPAAEAASRRALRQAGVRHDDVDVLELSEPARDRGGAGPGSVRLCRAGIGSAPGRRGRDCPRRRATAGDVRRLQSARRRGRSAGCVPDRRIVAPAARRGRRGSQFPARGSALLFVSAGWAARPAAHVLIKEER